MIYPKQGGIMVSHFGYDDGLHGLLVVGERQQLSDGCITVQEVDSSIQLINSELDRPAVRMKATLASRTPPSNEVRDV